MALSQEKTYTIDDIYALPEGKRAELIDGQMYMMAPPNTTHQRISHFLEWEIENYIQKKNGECEVFAAPFAVFLNKDNTNYVEPDLSVIVYDLEKNEKSNQYGFEDDIPVCIFEDFSISIARLLSQYSKN